MNDRDMKARGLRLVRLAETRWGKGWRLLSAAQRENAVCYEITMLVLAQDESTVPSDSPLGQLQEIGRAAFAALGER